MADSIAFNEGLTEVINNGLPATVYFLLSTKKVGTQQAGEHKATDTLAGGVSEITTGTGYSRKSEAEPTAVNGVVTFAVKTWTTGAATDWPSNAKSWVAVTTADNTGKAICAGNLRTAVVRRHRCRNPEPERRYDRKRVLRGHVHGADAADGGRA